MTQLTLTTLAISRHDGILVIRDDIIPGGTKTRAIDAILKGATRHVAYASPAYGYAQVALAHGVRPTLRTAHIFVAKRKRLHPNTQQAAAAGARIHEVAPGYLTQTRAEATRWCEEHAGTLLPFGFDTPTFSTALAARIREAVDDALTIDFDANAAAQADQETLRSPAEVWVAAGSGTISRALQQVWPSAAHHAVAVGRHPDAGNATIHAAPESFERDAQQPPPYPATPNFDAKVWRFAQGRGPGTLIWNVAG